MSSKDNTQSDAVTKLHNSPTSIPNTSSSNTEASASSSSNGLQSGSQSNTTSGAGHGTSAPPTNSTNISFDFSAYNFRKKIPTKAPTVPVTLNFLPPQPGDAVLQPYGQPARLSDHAMAGAIHALDQLDLSEVPLPVTLTRDETKFLQNTTVEADNEEFMGDARLSRIFKAEILYRLFPEISDEHFDALGICLSNRILWLVASKYNLVPTLNPNDVRSGADPLEILISLTKNHPEQDRWLLDVFGRMAVGAYIRICNQESIPSEKRVINIPRRWLNDFGDTKGYPFHLDESNVFQVHLILCMNAHLMLYFAFSQNRLFLTRCLNGPRLIDGYSGTLESQVALRITFWEEGSFEVSLV
jgi:hypothetical protein